MVSVLTWLFSRFTIALLGVVVALLYSEAERREFCLPGKVWSRYYLWAVLVWLTLWGQPVVINGIGVWLERPYPYLQVEDQPVCDAIVLLGGGMGCPRTTGAPPEMFSAADRVWHAARLWHAGRAKVIIASGCSEAQSSVPFLRALGVPSDVIWVEGRARNTIENGIYVQQMISEKKLSPKVLLVTSAWHMRRAMMIFRSVGLDPVPAAIDHEAVYGMTTRCNLRRPRLNQFLPNAQSMAIAGTYVKECQGLLGDWFRLMWGKEE